MILFDAIYVPSVTRRHGVCHPAGRCTLTSPPLGFHADVEFRSSWKIRQYKLSCGAAGRHLNR